MIIENNGIYKCVVITDIVLFQQLREEWDDLWIAAKGSFFQTYAYCLHSWYEIGVPTKKSLFCIVVRENGKLVLVWPLMKGRKGPLRILRPLGPSAAEPHDILLDPSCYTYPARLAYKMIKYAKCDMLNLPFVTVGSILDRIIAKDKNIGIDPDVAPYANIQDQTDWNTYFKLLGTSSSRQQLTRKRRRLAELGNLKCEIVDPVKNPIMASTLIGWMLQEKQIWAKRVNKLGYWTSSNEYRNLLVKWFTDANNVQKCYVYALMINDEPVAVKLITFSIINAELIIASYHSDPKYGKYSPGNVLDEFWIKDAFDKRLNIDFGLGAERYKMFWARNNQIAMATYQVPLTFVGRCALMVWRKMRERVRKTKESITEE